MIFDITQKRNDTINVKYITNTNRVKFKLTVVLAEEKFKFYLVFRMSEMEASLTNDPFLIKSLQAHKNVLTDLCFNPKSNQFASSSEDHKIMLWNLDDEIRSYNFAGHTDVVTGVDFSYDGKLLASSSKDTTVRLWVPTIKGGVSSFKAHTSSVNCVNFSPNGLHLLTGANDKSAKVWDVSKKQFLSSFVGHNNWVKCAKFSPNGEYVLSAAEDHTVRLWDVRSGQCEHTFTSPKSNPTYLDIHQNNNAVAVAMDSGSVRMYDIRQSKLHQHYTIHDGCSNCVCWHPHACYFMSCGKDGKVIIVDVIEGRPLYTLNGHEGSVSTCQFSKDGSIMATGGVDCCVMVWKTNFTDENS